MVPKIVWFLTETSPEEALRHAAEKTGGKPARLMGVHPVTEVAPGAPGWDGQVSEFYTPQGTLYSWLISSGRESQVIAMLHTAQANSPAKAVQAWIAQSASSSPETSSAE
jgi:hypothetical protein